MTRPNRRELLIKKMEDLEAREMGCRGCQGTCCTFEANSMMLTPLEALELITYLKENQLLVEELKIKLLKNISDYRLEPKYLNGRRSYLRKTYTCPFFGFIELGCPLPREIKPYGCLAFDSHHPTLKAGEHCFSEKDVLIEREKLHPEEVEMNHRIREEFKLDWEKSPIPLALLALWDKI